jgi:hypothetical protein
MLRIVSDRARRRYSQCHVDARVAQVGEMRQRSAVALQSAQDLAQVALAGAREHLWLPPSVRARVAAVHAANIASAQALHDDLQALAQGFADLPMDVASLERAPEPLEWAP